VLAYSGICSATAQLITAGVFNTAANTGNQIVTSAGNATVTSIASTLFGGAGLTASTVPTVGDNDDGFWDLALPFNISYNGTTYSSIYIGANSFITFGAGSQEWSNLGPARPALPKIMISAADNSAQRIYFGTVGSAPNRTYRVRWEGTNARVGTLGSPNMVWEATFYENAPAQIDIQIGVNAAGLGSVTFFDCRFSGTSAACPVAAGLIATAIETNRSWGWPEVRAWLQSLNLQSDTTFYQGPDPVTATSADWADLNSLMGGSRRVGYNNIVLPVAPGMLSGSGLSINGSGLSITFN